MQKHINEVISIVKMKSKPSLLTTTRNKKMKTYEKQTLGVKKILPEKYVNIVYLILEHSRSNELWNRDNGSNIPKAPSSSNC
jgi:predicted MarR family transcription regulator